MLAMIPQIAKAIGGFAAPWAVKLLTWLVALTGADVSAVQISDTATTVVSIAVGIVVWAVANRAKPA